MKLHILIVGLVVMIRAGCSSTPVETEVDGTWGGDHITLSVSGSSTTIELDCAHGLFPEAIRTDDDGRFETDGVLVLEHGGPIREGEPEDVHPAVYSGRVVGDQMTLSIAFTDLASPVQTFRLTRDQPGRLTKCL